MDWQMDHIVTLVLYNEAKQEDRKSVLKEKIFEQFEKSNLNSTGEETLSELLDEYQELKEGDDVDTLETYYYNYFWPIFFPIALFCLFLCIGAVYLCCNCKRIGRH